MGYYGEMEKEARDIYGERESGWPSGRNESGTGSETI